MTTTDAVLSCGHQGVGHNAAVAGFDREGNKCVRHMVLCSSCLELERSYDNLLCRSDLHKSARQALEALEGFAYHGKAAGWSETITNLRAAIKAVEETK